MGPLRLHGILVDKRWGHARNFCKTALLTTMASGINILFIFFRYPKQLFWISEISIWDIQNNYFGYAKYLFRISIKKLFRISKIMFSDIWNSYFGYLKFFFWISVKNSSLLRISKIVFQTSEIFFWISRITISDFWKRRLNVNSTCHRQHTALLKPTRTHVRTSEFTRTYVSKFTYVRTSEFTGCQSK